MNGKPRFVIISTEGSRYEQYYVNGTWVGADEKDAELGEMFGYIAQSLDVQIEVNPPMGDES